MAGDQHELAPVVGERVVECEPCALHARQPSQAIFNVAIQSRELVRRVIRRRTIDLHKHSSWNFEPEVLALKVAQAPRQHRRSGDEDDRQRRLNDQQRVARKR